MAALSLARCAAVAIADARRLQQRPTSSLLVILWARRLSATLISAPVHASSSLSGGKASPGKSAAFTAGSRQ